MEARERNLINHTNYPPQSNQESSSRLSFSSRNETLDHLQPPAPAPPPLTTARPAVRVVVRYRECLKNHAANMGSHILDGCGEFMPGGQENTPESLKCAACECHRSFHRREVDGDQSQTSNYHYHTQLHTAAPTTLRAAAVHLPPATQQHSQRRSLSHHHHSMPPVMMAFGGGANGAPAESSSEDFNVFNGAYGGVQLMGRSSKKRFRTKFSEEQKEKMFDFAERIRWKMKKEDEEEVLRFCNEVGLKKQVFKVWMHNNKQAAKKK